MTYITRLQDKLERAERFMKLAFDANHMNELAVWERHRDKVQAKIDSYHYLAGLARAQKEDPSEDGAFERN